MRDENEATDLSDLGTYRLLFAAALFPLAIVLGLLTTLTYAVGFPRWVRDLLPLLWITAPIGFATWWTWRQPALRTAGGRIISRRSALRAMFYAWVLAVAYVGLQMEWVRSL
jgi:hypothetical protein